MAPRFGLFLSAQHPPEIPASQIARDCCEQVRLARDLGFHDVSAGQHFLSQPYQMLQPVPLLARIAADAGEMRVCSGILLLTLLNPVEVAENAATLDAITDGRFVLGLGLGYRQEENDAFGLPARRLSIFEQKLDVVRRLLEGEVVTAEGHGFKLEQQQLARSPTQAAAPADLAGREQRQGRPASRTTGGCLAAEPAHEPGGARAPAQAVRRRARALGRSAATEVPDHQGALRRRRRRFRHADRPALPRGQVRGLRAVGAERGDAAGRHAAPGVRASSRAAAASSWDHRRPVRGRCASTSSVSA